MADRAEADVTDSARAAPAARALRWWPGGLIAGLYWALRVGGRLGPFAPFFNPLPRAVGYAAALALLVWWLFFSRARLADRLLGLAVVLVGGAAAAWLVHDSVRTLHRDGVVAFVAPLAVSAAIGWLLVARWTTVGVRRAGLVGIVLGLWGGFLLVRVVDGSTEWTWRWSPTAEQRFLSQRAQATAAPAAPVGPLEVAPGDWPQFRGPNRDSRVEGARIETDWERHPPKLVWKQRIGPGWGSFAVVGDYCFTQEQRGEDEAVACYRLDDGVEAWSHVDRARYWTSAAGAGPRATPTFHDHRIYTSGATGIVNCLDASTGHPIWQRDLTKDTGASVPDWGYSGSPLVVGELMVVFAGGGEGKGTVAYRAADGQPAWLGGTGTHSFSSAQLARLGGVEQVLVAHNLGLDALAPDDGTTLWQHAWNMEGYARMLQPCVLSDDRVVLASGYGIGSRLLNVRQGGDAWQVEAVWTSKRLVPYYSDFVVHQGHAYGFDGNIFCCVDLQTGERKWKKGRYGYGQVLLLPEQAMLVVLGEDGTAVLVAADPAGLVEVSRCGVLEGITRNHPVLVRGKLLVRNSEQAACYELTLP